MDTADRREEWRWLAGEYQRGRGIERRKEMQKPKERMEWGGVIVERMKGR